MNLPLKTYLTEFTNNGVVSIQVSFNLHLAAIGIEGVITGGISGQTGMNVNEVPVDNPYLASIYNIHYKVI